MKTSSAKSRNLLEEFVASGHRMTTQRRALLEVIETAEVHLDAATLLRLAKERDASIDRATVYRTIELLKKLHLIDELDLMHLNGEKHFYEVRRGREHIHLACFRCGKITEFTSQLYEELKREIQKESGFHISAVRMEVGGRCSSCNE